HAPSLVGRNDAFLESAGAACHESFAFAEPLEVRQRHVVATEPLDEQGMQLTTWHGLPGLDERQFLVAIGDPRQPLHFEKSGSFGPLIIGRWLRNRSPWFATSSHALMARPALSMILSATFTMASARLTSFSICSVVSPSSESRSSCAKRWSLRSVRRFFIGS